MYNIMTCSGWTSGYCSIIRIGFIILFFIFAIIEKWGKKEVNIEFSLIFSLILGFFSYWLVAILSGSFQWSLIAGLILGLIGGYGVGIILGGTEQDPVL
ncbi:MAG: hypothetical protein PHX96_00755 [Candidatus Nanoarchaeia archaeon]|nr:hypothetical protein [Candidatus Nanoarchaeia archaeon]